LSQARSAREDRRAHGVGYDSVDVKACTDNGVVLTNTPTASVARGDEHPRADLALSHKLARRRADAHGRWSETTNYMASVSREDGGSIGVGNIGGELFRCSRRSTYASRYDPYAKPADARRFASG